MPDEGFTSIEAALQVVEKFASRLTVDDAEGHVRRSVDELCAAVTKKEGIEPAVDRLLRGLRGLDDARAARRRRDFERESPAVDRLLNAVQEELLPALRRAGYQIGHQAREAGAFVVFGGIHATLYPEEAHELGGAHAVVKGDGDLIWAQVLDDCVARRDQLVYEGGRVEPEHLLPARWDLMPSDRYMWASVQTVRGCPKHCSLCSVWKTDGQRPRQRASDGVIQEVVELRRRGFRFIALADDNFYPVTLTDLQMAARRTDPAQFQALSAIRAERFELMRRLAQLPDDMVFFTQITMEAAEDPEFLDAMNKARIKGALVGVESVTPEGLKDVHKGFNAAGEDLVDRLRVFEHHGVHVLGSFIFGLPSDRPSTFDATVAVAQRAGVTFAQFVMLTPFPGTTDFAAWEQTMETDTTRIAGIPLTRHWLIPDGQRPKIYTPHPAMSPDDIRRGTQGAWDRFYSFGNIWERSRCVQALKSRVALGV